MVMPVYYYGGHTRFVIDTANDLFFVRLICIPALLAILIMIISLLVFAARQAFYYKHRDIMDIVVMMIVSLLAFPVIVLCVGAIYYLVSFKI